MRWKETYLARVLSNVMWEGKHRGGAWELFVLLTRQLHASLLLAGAHIRFRLVSFARVNALADVLILAMPY